MSGSFIDTLQLDLVSSCNARCPLCLRQNRLGLPQSGFPKNKHLDLHLLEQVLRDPSLAFLQRILLCGNYGDALASPHLVEIVDRMTEIHPKTRIHVHSNGGLGGQDVWEKLAMRLRGRRGYVRFSIDGLKDTNHLYRRGVSWDLLMRNVETFIRSGGRAVWKFIVFEHNRHQIEEARKISEEMGFAHFDVTANYSPDRYPYPSEEEALRRTPFLDQEMESEFSDTEPLQAVKIDCLSKQEKSVFVDFEGKVWPCCWTGGLEYSADGIARKRHREKMHEIAGEDSRFNSLSSHALSAILDHPWFQEMIFPQPQEASPRLCSTRHFQCLTKCGQPPELR